MSRTLIVNADDLGLTLGVNDAIFRAHEHGILTSASLFANGPETPDAIRRLCEYPLLDIGVHLALVDGAPTLPPDRVPTLVDANGRFHRSWKPFILACLRGQVSLDDVERELTAQIERLHDAGTELTHLDGHKHVHAYPPIFAIVSRLAARFGIDVVRVPYERTPALQFGPRVRTATTLQAMFNAAMRPWASRDYRIALSDDVRTTHFIGRVHTGVLDGDSFARLVRGLPEGVTELMVHPGYVDAELKQTGTRLLASREEELDLLCSVHARLVLAGEHVDLVHHDLSHVAKRSVSYVA